MFNLFQDEKATLCFLFQLLFYLKGLRLLTAVVGIQGMLISDMPSIAEVV